MSRWLLLLVATSGPLLIWQPAAEACIVFCPDQIVYPEQGASNVPRNAAIWVLNGPTGTTGRVDLHDDEGNEVEIEMMAFPDYVVARPINLLEPFAAYQVEGVSDELSFFTGDTIDTEPPSPPMWHRTRVRRPLETTGGPCGGMRRERNVDVLFTPTDDAPLVGLYVLETPEDAWIPADPLMPRTLRLATDGAIHVESHNYCRLSFGFGRYSLAVAAIDGAGNASELVEANTINIVKCSATRVGATSTTTPGWFLLLTLACASSAGRRMQLRSRPDGRT